MAIVTFTTDFGTADSYAAEMKGVVLAGCPDAVLVDVTHAIEPGCIREAAWVVSTAYRAFPEGSIHVAVVDPGVGGARRALAVEARGHVFLAPDNGLLSPLLERPDSRNVVALDDETSRRVDRDTTTFDGRERFARAAARVASGEAIDALGSPIRDTVRAEPFRPAFEGDRWRAEIVRVDRFGNLVTCARASFLRTILGAEWRGVRVEAGRRSIEGVRAAYQEVPEGELLLTVGSAGTLEISCHRGRADVLLGLRRGDHVEIAGGEARPNAEGPR